MKREKIDKSKYAVSETKHDEMAKGDMFLYDGYKSPFRVIEVCENGLKAYNTWTLKIMHFNITGCAWYTYDKLVGLRHVEYEPVIENGVYKLRVK